jgi:hypothetical protein
MLTHYMPQFQFRRLTASCNDCATFIGRELDSRPMKKIIVIKRLPCACYHFLGRATRRG